MRACSMTPVRPSASASRRSSSIAAPFSQCRVTRAPWRRAERIERDDGAVVDLQAVGIGEVELERRDAVLDRLPRRPIRPRRP